MLNGKGYRSALRTGAVVHTQVFDSTHDGATRLPKTRSSSTGTGSPLGHPLPGLCPPALWDRGFLGPERGELRRDKRAAPGTWVPQNRRKKNTKTIKGGG